MKTLSTMWSFLAGDSKLAPLSVFVALIVVFVMERTDVSNMVVIATFPAIIACGLAASMFERR